MRLTLPEDLKLVLSTTGASGAILAGNALSTADYVCMKNVNKAWLVLVHQGANDTDLVVSFSEATAVAGTGAAAVTATMPIWKDVDAGSASDTLSRQTDAASLTIDPATQNPVLAVFEWDPAKFSAGYDCLAVVGTGGHASNYVMAMWFLDTRYPADQPPAAITD